MDLPALVLTGGADYPWMIDVGRRLAEAMPNGRHRVLEGQEHAVPPRCSCRYWRISFRTAQGRESEPSSKPLFTRVRRRGVLRSSDTHVHVPLREVLLDELGGGWYLLDDVHHDATWSPTDEVALSGRQVL